MDAKMQHQAARAGPCATMIEALVLRAARTARKQPTIRPRLNRRKLPTAEQWTKIKVAPKSGRLRSIQRQVGSWISEQHTIENFEFCFMGLAKLPSAE